MVFILRAYPIELRVRVVAAVEEDDCSIPEIASLFNVSLTFVKKMLRLHRAGNNLSPRHGGGPTPSLNASEHKVLREHIAAQPDATLAQLQQVLAQQCSVSVSRSTICRTLQELGLPRKKSLFAKERDPKQRKQFRRLTDKLDPDGSVFVDEMGSNLAMTRLYARAAPGPRVEDEVPADHKGNISTIGAMGLAWMPTALSLPGPIDGETMIYFVEEMLAPTLQPGDIVFLITVRFIKPMRLKKPPARGVRV